MNIEDSLIRLRANLEAKHGRTEGKRIYKKIVKQLEGRPTVEVAVIVSRANSKYNWNIKPRPTGFKRQKQRKQTYKNLPHVVGDTLPVGISPMKANMLAFLGTLEPPRPVYKPDALPSLFQKGDRVVYKPMMEAALVLHVRGNDRFLIKTDSGTKRWVPYSDISFLTSENEEFIKTDNGIVAKARKMMNI